MSCCKTWLAAVLCVFPLLSTLVSVSRDVQAMTLFLELLAVLLRSDKRVCHLTVCFPFFFLALLHVKRVYRKPRSEMTN